MRVAILVICSLLAIGFLALIQSASLRRIAPALATAVPLAFLGLVLIDLPHPQPVTRFRVLGVRLGANTPIQVGNGPNADVAVTGLGPAVPLTVGLAYEPRQDAFRVRSGPGPVPVAVGRRPINGLPVGDRAVVDLLAPTPLRLHIRRPRWPILCNVNVSCDERILTLYENGRLLRADTVEITRSGILLSDLGIRLPIDVMLHRWCPRSRGPLPCSRVWVSGGSPGAVLVNGRTVPNEGWLGNARGKAHRQDTLRVGVGRSQAKLVLSSDAAGTQAFFGGNLWQRSWPLLGAEEETVYRVAGGGLAPSMGTLPLLDLNVVELGPRGHPYAGVVQYTAGGWEWHGEGRASPIAVGKPVELPGSGPGHLVQIERDRRAFGGFLTAGICAWLLGVLVAWFPPAGTPRRAELRTLIFGVAYTLFAVRSLLAWRVAAAPPHDWKGLETTLLALCALPALIWLLEQPSRWRNDRLATYGLWGAAALLVTLGGAAAASESGARIALERLLTLLLVLGFGSAGLFSLNRALTGRGVETVASGPGAGRNNALPALEPERAPTQGDSTLLLLRAISVLVVLCVGYAVLSMATRPALWVGMLLAYLIGVTVAYGAVRQRTGIKLVTSLRRQRLQAAAGGISTGAVTALLVGELAPNLSLEVPLLIASAAAGLGAFVVWRIVRPSRGPVSGPEYPVSKVLPSAWFAVSVPLVSAALLFPLPGARRLTIVLGYGLVLAGMIVVARFFVLLLAAIELRMRPGPTAIASRRHRLFPVALALGLFTPLLIADHGLFLVALAPALVVASMAFGLAGRDWLGMVLGALLLVFALGVFRLPLAGLGQPEKPFLWFSATHQVRAAAVWAPAELEDRLLTSTSEDGRVILRTLQQEWGMRVHAAPGRLSGRGIFGAPFTGEAIPADVAMTDNVTSVFLLSEHGFLGGAAVLLLYLAGSAALLFGAREAARAFRDVGRAALLTGLGLLVIIPTLYMVAANVGALPLTGQNVPLLGLRSQADAALGVWMFALALAALPRSTAPDWISQDQQTQRRRDQVRRRIKNVGLVAGLATAVVAYLVFRGTFAEVGPFALDRFYNRLEDQARRGILAVDTAAGDSLMIIGGGSQAAEGSFLRRLVAESNAFARGRRVPEDDCLASTPVLSATGSGTVAVDQTVCRLPSPFDVADLWNGALAAGPGGPALVVTDGGAGVTLVAGVRGYTSPDCGAPSLPETPRATLNCHGSQIELGPDVGGGYEARFVDGAVYSRRALRRGVVLDARNSTLVVDSLTRGSYALGRWRNGKFQRAATPGGPPLFARLDELLGTSLRADRVPRDADVHLALRPQLMVELDSALARVCNGMRARVRLCAVPIVDPATGDILALSSWERDSSTHRVLEPSFRNHRSGSTVKPFLAAAALSVYPRLVELSVPHQEQADVVAGWTLEADLRSSLHAPCTGPRVDFDCFLGGSNNLFAASLGFLAMAPPDGALGLPRMEPANGTPGFYLGGRRLVSRPQLVNAPAGIPEAAGSPLADAFTQLFGAGTTQAQGDRPDSTVWEPLVAGGMLRTNAAWEAVSPQVPRLPLDELASGPNPFWSLATFFYGDRDNYWSNAALVRSLVRLMNGTGTNLRLIDRVGMHNIPNPDAPGVVLGPVRDTILDGMRDVVRRGTASGTVRAGRFEAAGFRIYGKTGTLDNLNPNSTSFLFGVLPPAGAPAECIGAAGIVYIEFESGRVPAAARTFTNEVVPVLARHLWTACGGANL